MYAKRAVTLTEDKAVRRRVSVHATSLDLWGAQKPARESILLLFMYKERSQGSETMTVTDYFLGGNSTFQRSCDAVGK